MLSRIRSANIFRHFLTFSIPRQTGALADRLEAACQVLERAFPAEKLCFASPHTAGGADTLVKARHKYFRQRGRTKMHWFDLHNGKAVRGWGGGPMVDEVRIAFGGRIDRHDLGLLSVTAQLPDSPWSFCEKLLVDIGDATEACYAVILPDGNEKLWATQFDSREVEHDPTLLQRGIPQLHDFTYFGPAVAAQPMYLGWLNYWSAETSSFLGFPDEIRHATLLAHSYRTPARAWLTKLTAEPLDTRRSDHVDVLAAAYRELPRLGLRVRKGGAIPT